MRLSRDLSRIGWACVCICPWAGVRSADETVLPQGNPPAIDVWLNGRPVTYLHDETRRLPDKGSFRIQVHVWNRWAKEGKVLYRNVQVRELGN